MFTIPGKKCLLGVSRTIVLFFVLFPGTTEALQRTDSDSSYYPLETGNIWVYTYRLDLPPRDTVQVLSDTVMPNLKKYFAVRRTFREYPYSPIQFERCDSGGTTWLYNESLNVEVPLDNFSLPLGSRWPSFRKSEFGDSAQTVWRGKTLATFSSDSLDVIVIRYKFRYGEDNTIQFARGIGVLYEEFWPKVPNLLAGARAGIKTYGVLTGVGGSPRKALPSSSHLEQNYPNPFNPSTMIQYTIGGLTNGPPVSVRLVIYNILGQEVKTLVERLQQPGTYRVTWDGTDNSGKRAPSGVYIYRLMAGSYVNSKTMVFVK